MIITIKLSGKALEVFEIEKKRMEEILREKLSSGQVVRSVFERFSECEKK